MLKCSSCRDVASALVLLCWLHAKIIQIILQSTLRPLMLEPSNLAPRVLFRGQDSAPLQKDQQDTAWSSRRHLGGPTEVSMATPRWRLLGLYVAIPLVLCTMSWKPEVFGGRKQRGCWFKTVSHIHDFDLGPDEHIKTSTFFQLSVNKQCVHIHT